MNQNQAPSTGFGIGEGRHGAVPGNIGAQVEGVDDTLLEGVLFEIVKESETRMPTPEENSKLEKEAKIKVLADLKATATKARTKAIDTMGTTSGPIYAKLADLEEEIYNKALIESRGGMN